MTCSEYQVRYEGAEEVCPEAYRPMMRIANRGGGWSSVQYRVRSAARTSSSTHYKNRDLGLRVVMESREGE
jgi:formylglycine-generating enzyme required for sulfatase activity